MLFSALGQMRLMTHGEPLKVVRRKPGLGNADTVVVGGIRRHRGQEELEMTLVVFPASGKDLALLPEGDRLTESLWFFQSCKQPDVLASRDIVRRNGKSYQIQMIEEWGPYVRAMGQLVDSGQERLR